MPLSTRNLEMNSYRHNSSKLLVAGFTDQQVVALHLYNASSSKPLELDAENIRKLLKDLNSKFTNLRAQLDNNIEEREALRRIYKDNFDLTKLSDETKRKIESRADKLKELQDSIKYKYSLREVTQYEGGVFRDYEKNMKALNKEILEIRDKIRLFKENLRMEIYIKSREGYNLTLELQNVDNKVEQLNQVLEGIETANREKESQHEVEFTEVDDLTVVECKKPDKLGPKTGSSLPGKDQI
jgi:hypothetical protein